LDKRNWQEIIDYLNLRGYEVINTSFRRNAFFIIVQFLKINHYSNNICYRRKWIFIGLSSGLSWLAWALNKEVIMISNFTNEEHEFKCHRPVVKVFVIVGIIKF
jgi:hypothetical protein